MNELKVTDRRDVREAPSVSSRDITPMDLLRIATSQGADIQKLEQLMTLQERYEANNARKAFTVAMAAFKAHPPQILKNKHVAFDTSKGRTEYDHATHDEVTNKIIVALSPHGLSHRWSMRQADGMIFVTCTITHELGHSESVELYGPPDVSGSKSPIQAIASTVTLLQRYTLLAVTGLSTEDLPDAGDTGGDQPTEPPPEGLEQWQADMRALADCGTEELSQAWGKSKTEFRRYTVKYLEEWWLDLKERAKKVAA
jgi:ERF superfamily